MSWFLREYRGEVPGCLGGVGAYDRLVLCTRHSAPQPLTPSTTYALPWKKSCGCPWGLGTDDYLLSVASLPALWQWALPSRTGPHWLRRPCLLSHGNDHCRNLAGPGVKRTPGPAGSQQCVCRLQSCTGSRVVYPYRKHSTRLCGTGTGVGVTYWSHEKHYSESQQTSVVRLYEDVSLRVQALLFIHAQTLIATRFIMQKV